MLPPLSPRGIGCMRTPFSKGRKKNREVAGQVHHPEGVSLMNMQSVSLSALEASGANPRRKIDRKAIEGLAASIRTDCMDIS